MERFIDWLHNRHGDWLGTRHDWLGLCPTIPNLGYATALVAVFNRSWKKHRDLHEKQIQLGLEQHKLISDVATRWAQHFK